MFWEIFISFQLLWVCWFGMLFLSFPNKKDNNTNFYKVNLFVHLFCLHSNAKFLISLFVYALSLKNLCKLFSQNKVSSTLLTKFFIMFAFGDFDGTAFQILLSEILNYNMNNTIINPQKSLKTFVFEREDTQQSVIVDEQLDLSPPFINLSYLFSVYCPLAQNKVSIYDPNISRFVLLSKIGSENGYVPKAFLQPSFILIRYIAKVQYTGESDSIDSNLQNQSRPQKKENRSKERSIGEVIQLVKKWRDLHMHGHKALKRRLNLQDAAKIVGISKKSLDDYYCQLRLGELYNFNFYDNLNEKMGVLRSYVKNYRPERQTKRRQNQKHPKNLRIIDQFDLQTKKLKELEFPMEEKEEQPLPNPISARTNSQQQDNRMVQQNNNPFEQASQSSPIYKQLFSLQNQFFKGFDLALDYQGDPYFDVERDFRKKDFALDSDSFLLFD